MSTLVVVAPYAAGADAAAAEAESAAEVAEAAVEGDGDEAASAIDAADDGPVFEVLIPDAPYAFGLAAQETEGSAETTNSSSATPTSDTGDDAESVPALDPTIPHADLSVTITPEREPVLSESFLAYTVEVTNDGPDEAENVVVTATLPVSASFMVMTGCWLNNDTFPECHLNEIPAGESRTFEILTWMNPTAGGVQNASVEVTSETNDPDPTNNDASVVTTINTRASWRDIAATADLSIAKVDAVDPIPAEGQIEYTVTVVNAGPNAAVSTTMTETLPTGVTLVSVNGCQGSSGVPECDLGTIPPGQTRIIDIVVSVDAGTVGDITNAVSVESRSFDPDGSNNVATETTTVEFGTIIIEKQTDPDGSTETFTFTGDLAGDIGDGETLEATGLLAGTYTSTEIVPAGWGIVDITCDDTDSSGDPATGIVTFNVAGDETVTCVVTNALLGSITIVKDTVGVDGSFNFTGDLGPLSLTTVGNSASTTVTDLLPESYAVTETNPALAFYLTGLECVDPDGGSTTDLGTLTATIDLDAGEDVTCTFTNSESGSVRITKNTIGGDGSFDFDSDIVPFTIGTSGGTATIITGGVAPGTYEITEVVNPAFDLTGLSCSDPDNESGVDLSARTVTVDLDPGETVSCTFTNTERGTITVEKVALPAGETDTFDFSGDINGSIGDGGTISVQVPPGTYTAEETLPVGWSLADITCDDADSIGSAGILTATFNVDVGEEVTCTFTNEKLGTIIVEKQTLPDGDPQSFGFSGNVNGSITDDGQLIVNNLVPGTYTATEAVPSGWTLDDITCDDANSSGSTGTATATFNVEPGETVTCVFTNHKLGTIVVEKQTDPDAPGGSFSFTGAVNGSIGNGGQLIVNNVAPGSYGVTESDPAPLHDLTNIICDDGASATPSTVNVGTRTATFNVEIGETVTCVFTNTQRGSIVVEKQTLPDGAPGTFAFTGDVNGSISDDGQLSVSNLVPGTYTASETPLAGFDLTDITCDDANSSGDTGTATATFNVDPGETVTCVFTNTQRGSIVVEKQTLPDGAPGSFAFTGDVNGSISDDGQLIVNDLVPGTYAVTETDPTSAFDLTGLTCDDGASATPSTGTTGTRTATFNVDPGETVTCVFTNTQRATLRFETLTAPAGQPGSFTYSGAATTTHTHGITTTVFDRLPGAHTVTQDSFPVGLDLSDITCSDGASTTPSTGDVGTATATFNLEPGEDVTCTFTNSLRGSITIQKNSVADDGDFAFTGDLGAFNLDTTGTSTASTTFNDIIPGTVSVTESDPTPAVLTGLACNDGGSATPSTTSLATRTATIELDPGEDVTCTFTNSFNLPPAITGGPTAAVSAAENQTAVTDVDSTDSMDSEGSGLTYSFTTVSGGGVDNGFFSIDTNTGVLTFTAAPDFEAFADSDGDNDYEVQVTVTDSGGLTDFQDITVTLTNANDAPVVTASAGVTAFTEDAGAVTVDGAVTVTDQDGGNLASATVTITNLLDGADEVLAATTGGTSIVASYVGGTLTLTGPDTIANFQTVLQSVTYNNASNTPDETDRVIRFVANDGTVDSNNGDKTVSVAATNDLPTTVNDSYSVPVNVVLDAGASSVGAIELEDADGVLTKGTDDSDPEGTALTVTGIVGCADLTAPFEGCATSGGGTVDMNADGTFTYLSQPGESDATDTFQYLASDGTIAVPGTVTITFGDTIWFLDSAAGAGGDGTSAAPFNTVTAFNDTATDEAGDIIFVSGTFTDAGFTLLANQQLIGDSIGLTSGGLTIAPSGGAAPTLGSAAGFVVVELSSNNTIRGFAFTGSAGAGSIVGTNFGTPTINNVTINGPGALLTLTNGNMSNITLGSMTSTSSNVDGLLLDNVTGTFNVTAPVSISNSVGDGIDIRNSSATVNFSGLVTVNNPGGTAGVTLTNNTGSVNFSGGLDINATTTDGLRATGSGTVTATGASNTIDTTTGTAVFIQNVTIGAAGVTLASVNANGSGGGTTGGIFLENTGTSGFFTVNGGTIQNAEGANLAAEAVSAAGDGIGIHLENAQNVTLSGVTVTTSQNFGIRGHDLSGTTTFANLNVGGTHGTTAASDESAVSIDGMTGTFNVTGGFYAGGHEDVFDVTTTLGTLTANFTGITINASQAASGDNGLQLISTGSATMNVNVNNSAFNAARSVMLFVDVGGTGGGTVNIGNTTANTFTQGQTNLPGGGAIEVLATGTNTVSTNISNNTITAGSNTFEGDVIVVGTTADYAGTHGIRLVGNTIGTGGVNGSAVAPAGAGDTGIVLSQNGTGTINALLDNNSIFDYNDRGIEVFFDAETAPLVGGTLNITVTNNTISDAGAENHALQFTGEDQVNTCMHVAGNDLTSAGDEVRVDVFGEPGATFNVVNLPAGSLTEAGIDTLWSGANTIGAGNVQVFSVAPSTIGTVASCPQP